jgi:phosphatidylglycerophosphatase A
MSADSGTAVPSVSDAARSSVATQRKPGIALFIATACGLGYIPVAPGTWGSLAGLIVAVLPFWVAFVIVLGPFTVWKIITEDTTWFSLGSVRPGLDRMLMLQCFVGLALAAIGVWSASKASRYWSDDDPQRVVIDEVSGQHLTLLIGCGLPIWWRATESPWTSLPIGFVTSRSALNWKYLLLGFILFRVFDIWKPFPARQAESLPGGWGIMADDWIAGIYAAIGLWLARAAGL